MFLGYLKKLSLKKMRLPFVHLIVMVAALASLSSATPAFAQGEPGLLDTFSGMFTVENNAESFDQRREGAKIMLEGYPCFSCTVFDSFAGAVFTGLNNFDAAGASLIPVLIGFGNLFALFYLFSNFVAGDASDLAGRWAVVWRLCLAIAAASVVLAAPVSIMWNYFYDVLFSIGTGVANQVGGSSGSCTVSGSGISVSNAPAGAVEALQQMSTTVCGAYEMTLDGIANGLAMMTQRDGWINSLVYIIAGIFVVLIYGFLALIFPLRFIDVVIRMAIVTMITPLLVVCLVFKPTRGYFSIAVSTILNATAQFAILTIIFKLGKQVFQEVSNVTIESPVATESGSLMIGAIAGEQDFTAVVVQALILVGVAVVFNGLVKSVPAIAAEFSRSSGGGMDAGGNAAVGMISRAATTVAGGAGAAAGVGMLRSGAAAKALKQQDMLSKTVQGAVRSEMNRTGRGVS